MRGAAVIRKYSRSPSLGCPEIRVMQSAQHGFGTAREPIRASEGMIARQSFSAFPGWVGAAMLLHTVRQDLLEGRLARLSIEDLPDDSLLMPMSAAYLTANPPGPAGRWLIERLRQCSGQHAARQKGAQPHELETSYAKTFGSLRAKRAKRPSISSPLSSRKHR